MLKEAQEIGEKIRRERGQQGLTQPELAERAGVSLPFLKRIELGKATVSAPLLGRLVKALNVPADKFLDHVESDVELADRLWRQHGLERSVRGLDFTAKKAVLQSKGLWKRA